jgi:hypothetical protein
MGYIDLPDPSQGTSLEGAGQERLGLVLYKLINKMLNTLILWLLVFLMSRSPAVENGGQNGIHRQQGVPKQYK